jgi:ribosomal protein L29
MRKKVKKQPKDMTTDELARHVFHPKVLRHVKKHIARINEKPIKK